MSPHQHVLQHLAKAEEFLDAARANLDAAHVNAATSNAVLAGINAKDAICLFLVGGSAKSRNHDDAVEELRRVGHVGRELAPTLQRLLQLKNASQYTNVSVTARDGHDAVRWATRLVEGASRLVAG